MGKYLIELKKGGDAAMSWTQWSIYLLIVLVVIAIIYYFVYRLKSNHAERIQELHALKDEVFSGAMQNQIEDGDHLAFSGESKAQYEQLIKDWDEVQERAFPEIENKIYTADRAAQEYKFSNATKYEGEAEEDMAAIQVELAKIRQGMEDFLDSAEENRKRVEQMKEAFHKIQSELLDNKSYYGPSVSHLEHQVDMMSEDFNRFELATETGDHIRAKDYLEKLEERITVLQDEMVHVPQLLEKINHTSVEVLEELASGYEELRLKNIAFPQDNIQEEVQNGYRMLSDIYDLVAQLQLSEADRHMLAFERMTDKLFDKMEKEFQASAQVKKDFAHIRTIFTSLYERNRQIKIETDRISQSYYLNDETLSYGSKKEQDIAHVQHHFESIQSRTTSQEVVYSEVLEAVEQVYKSAQQIYDDQDNFLDDLYNLGDEEQQVEANVKDFGNRMSELKQRLDRSNLPGIDDYFMELYQYTTLRIHDLANELDAIRLNMDQVRYLYETVSQEVPNLENQVDEMIKYARQTEQMIQILNRYRHEDSRVIEAIDMINYYYNHEFNYASAFRVASEQLHTIAPEEYEAFVKSI